MTAEQLKNSILKLAISGKLVPQDKNDEPASVLIEKIRKEKEKLINEGKIKKDKNETVIYKKGNSYYEKFIYTGTKQEKIVSSKKENIVGTKQCEPVEKCIDDEIPFEIPDGWEWCRLWNYCTDLFNGKSPVYEKFLTNYCIIGQAANKQNGIDLSEVKYTNKKFWDSMDEKFFLRNNDVLLNTLGNGTLGRSGIIRNLSYDLLTDGHLFIFRTISLHSSLFLYYFLQSRKAEIEKSANGTTNQTFLNISNVSKWLIPMPPFQEQKRIVSEIEKYLPLISEYDQLDTKLKKLDKEFPEKLKKSILQQAIKGKLVEQDPKDEPASVLLDKICKEKEKLIKEGKIKKDKNESIIYKRHNSYYEKLNGVEKCIDDEIPFEIPDGWEWCRLGNIIILISGQDLDTNKCNHSSEGVPYITGASNFINGALKINRWTKYGSIFAFNNDLLLTCKGTIGMMAFLTIDKAHIARQIMSIRPISNDNISINFIKLFFDFYVNQLKNIAKSIIPGINRENILNSLFPLPPLNEQDKIVKKVNKSQYIINIE